MIENKGANVSTDWKDHNGNAIKTVIVDGKEINIEQFQEATKLTVTENGTYKGLYSRVDVDIEPEVDVETVHITANGTYHNTPGKYIDTVVVDVFDTPFATEDIDWSTILR